MLELPPDLQERVWRAYFDAHVLPVIAARGALVDGLVRDCVKEVPRVAGSTFGRRYFAWQGVQTFNALLVRRFGRADVFFESLQGQLPAIDSAAAEFLSWYHAALLAPSPIPLPSTAVLHRADRRLKRCYVCRSARVHWPAFLAVL